MERGYLSGHYDKKNEKWKSKLQLYLAQRLKEKLSGFISW